MQPYNTCSVYCTWYNNYAPYLCTAVDTKTALPAGQLLEAVSGAEREQSAAPGEIPLGEWAATRVRPSLALHSLTTQLQLTHTSAQVGSAPQYPPLDKPRGGEEKRVEGVDEYKLNMLPSLKAAFEPTCTTYNWVLIQSMCMSASIGRVRDACCEGDKVPSVYRESVPR